LQMEGLLQKFGVSSETISSFINKLNIASPILLYDSNSDECSSNTLHSKIDKKGPTITFAIKGSKVCGGIAFKEWTSEDSWIFDDKAAIFTLTPELKVYKVNADYAKTALFRSINYGPGFGLVNFWIEFNPLHIAVKTCQPEYNLPLTNA